MTTSLWIILALAVPMLVYCLANLVRIDQVFKLRKEMIEKVVQLNRRELDAWRIHANAATQADRKIYTITGKFSSKYFNQAMEDSRTICEEKNKKRWEWYEQHSHNEMTFKLWKPLKSFYTNEPEPVTAYPDFAYLEELLPGEISKDNNNTVIH